MMIRIMKDFHLTFMVDILVTSGMQLSLIKIYFFWTIFSLLSTLVHELGFVVLFCVNPVPQRLVLLQKHDGKDFIYTLAMYWSTFLCFKYFLPCSAIL